MGKTLPPPFQAMPERNRFFLWEVFPKFISVCDSLTHPDSIASHDATNSIFQEQSSFAKDCRKKGGFFKCCVNSLTLNIFEKSRNSLIREGLIKDTPTSWCKSEGWPEVGRKRKDPCLLCFSDAMCTERDIETGKIKHTFIKEKKKEHGVI